MLVIFSHTHTHFADSSTKLAPSKDLMLLSADAISNKSSDTLRGVEAEKAILAGTLLHCKDKQKVLLLDDWLWLITKSPNGSQKVISKFVHVPTAMSRGFIESGLDLPSLSELVDNIAFYDKLVDACHSSGTFIGDIVYPSWLVLYTREQQRLELLGKAKATPPIVLFNEETFEQCFGKPAAPLEIVNDDIAIEVVNDAPSTHSEGLVIDVELSGDVGEQEQLETSLELPVRLNPAEFQDRFEVRGSAYSQACTAGASGWVSADGEVWFYGGKKNKVWTNAVPAVQPLEPAT